MLEESVTSMPSIWASMNSWFTPTVLFVLLNLMIGTIVVTSSLATHKPDDKQDEKQGQGQAQAQHNHHQLARSISMLQRLKSINFYSYRSQEPTNLTFASNSTLQHTPQQDYHQHQPPPSRAPSALQRLTSINSYLSQDPTAIAPPHKGLETPNDNTAQQVDVQKQEHEQEAEEEQADEEIQDQEQTLDEIYSKLQGHKVSRSKSDTNPTSGEVPTKLPQKMKKSASTKSAFAHFEEDDAVESRRPATTRERKFRMTEEEDDAEVDAKADDFINRFKQQLKLQRIDSIMRYKEMVNRGSEK